MAKAGDSEADDSYAKPSAPAWAIEAAQDLSLLPVDEFGAWQTEAGIPELGLMLLFEWDPDDNRENYPESAEAYYNTAHSVILGLQMGDSVEATFRRLRAHGPRGRPSASDRFNDDQLTLVVSRLRGWLPLSLARWWRRRLGHELRGLAFHWHLIKYDPARASGHYDDGTWTSFSDVGEEFNGVRLTRDAYERTEQAHLDAIEAMARESGVDSFLLDLNPDTATTSDLAFTLEGIRGALRGENDHWLWRAPDRSMYIVSGWDYHLYVGSHRVCERGLTLATQRGLHPRTDEGPSPHLYIE